MLATFYNSNILLMISPGSQIVLFNKRQEAKSNSRIYLEQIITTCNALTYKVYKRLGGFFTCTLFQLIYFQKEAVPF